MPEVVQVESLRHAYGQRIALSGVSFSVRRGELFGLLGPNGGGKTTLFRILTTLLPPTAGEARICGCDVGTDRDNARRHLGVVFQSPSLDIYLTARENLRHAGHLYGQRGRELESRIEARLADVELMERADEPVKNLSGGMRRRAEIAKGMLHDPDILILDEPSAGLDPSARRDLWRRLQALRESTGVTILFTTHYLEEADRCDRVVILDRGHVVVHGSPADLKSRIGGECLTIASPNCEQLCAEIAAEMGCPARLVDGLIRIETADGPALVARLMASHADRIHSILLGKPTLDDVFVRETGHRLTYVTASPAKGGE
ncbi:MAG: ABC transporter ATP-binding protein [Planctomycetota bacterium]|nr:MAG: ABC transporter ATP-binding protein [Planctomycetota bacterium]